MVLLCAVAVGIVTLTLIFGTSAGKIQAEYTKAVRRAGSTASAVLENATEDQYRQICSLSYIKNAGKRVRAGRAESGEKKLGEINLHGKKSSVLLIQIFRGITQKKSRRSWSL